MSDFNIGKTLKSFRENKSLSIEEVSKHLIKNGLKGAPKTIYGWERGHSEPDAVTLMTLCDLYGISDIMEAFGYKKKSPAPDEPETGDEFSEDIDALGIPNQAYELFYRLLVRRGYVSKGEDVTTVQADFFAGIIQIVDSAFPPKAIDVKTDKAG